MKSEIKRLENNHSEEVYENLGKAYSCSREMSWCTKKVYDEVKELIEVRENFVKYLSRAAYIALGSTDRKLATDTLTMIEIIKNDCKHFMTEKGLKKLDEMKVFLEL